MSLKLPECLTLNIAKRGFTLIELLVVIAIFGILATALAMMISPGEVLAKTRDTAKLAAFNELQRGLRSYSISNAAFPDQEDGWITAIVQGNHMSNAPSNPANFVNPCPFGTDPGVENGYCYLSNGNEAVVYAIAESRHFKSKITCAGTVTLMWNADAGVTGLDCDGPTAPDAMPEVRL